MTFRDLTFALRRLRATPTFAVFAVVTLALGIGATTAIYSIIRAALGPPPGVTTIDRLVTLNHSEGSSIPIIAFSYGDYLDLRARQTAFQDLAGWAFLRQSFTASGQAGSGWGELVSGEYFQVLGVQAEIGRVLQPADDSPTAPAVAVISHGVWQRFFGGVPDVVGRLIRVNGTNVEIVGVAQRAFGGLFNNGLVPSATWLPLSTARLLRTEGTSRTLDPSDRSSRWLQIRARLKPGVTLEAARTDVSGIAKQLDQSDPLGSDLPPQYRLDYRIGRPWLVRYTRDIAVNDGADRVVKPLAATVMAIVGLVLLVACTNLANLMLARGSGRRHESAVRLALGASRWQLVRAELAEGALIAVAGGFAGLGVARTLLVWLGTDLDVGGVTLHLVPRLDPTALGMSLAATLLALGIAGLVPALQSTRAEVRTALASGASAAALPRWRGRRSLIAGQVMVSVILVAIAGLCVGQLRAQSQNDTGLDLDRLALAETDFASQQYAEARAREIVTAVLADLGRRPNVVATAVSSGLPIGINTPGCSVGVGSKLTQQAVLLASTPSIFETLGVEILKGRPFGGTDTRTTAPVVVVNESAARSLFGTTDVINRAISIQRTRWAGEPEHPQTSRVIIGVVADTNTNGVGAYTGGAVYVPLDQHYEGKLVISVRTTGDPAAIVPAIRQALNSVDSSVAIVQAGTGVAIAGPSNVFLQVTAGLTGVLGAFALTLALIGLYGALSHVVLRRRREIGLRMALGADRSAIVRMVLRDGLGPVVSGLVAGLAIGVIARLTLTPLFVRLLPALDVFILALVPALMLGAGVVACLVPARRAARVDPNVALREL